MIESWAMNSSPDQTPERDVQRDRRNAYALIMSMADVTWRMFVPSVIFVGLGLWLGLSTHLGPWLAGLGLVVGLTTSFFLVKQQIGAVK